MEDICEGFCLLVNLCSPVEVNSLLENPASSIIRLGHHHHHLHHYHHHLH